MGHFVCWLPGTGDVRTTPKITIPFNPSILQKKKKKSTSKDPLEPEKNDVVNKSQHVIHKAIGWQKMLDDEEVESLSEIAQKEGLTRARVTQIMNLLNLPPEWKEFLLGLNDQKEIRRYSERRLRNCQMGRYAPPPQKKKFCREPMDEVLKNRRGRQNQPPKIIVMEIDEPLPHLNFEAQKKLVQKAALRKLKELEGGKNK